MDGVKCVFKMGNGWENRAQARQTGRVGVSPLGSPLRQEMVGVWALAPPHLPQDVFLCNHGATRCRASPLDLGFTCHSSYALMHEKGPHGAGLVSEVSRLQGAACSAPTLRLPEIARSV